MRSTVDYASGAATGVEEYGEAGLCRGCLPRTNSPSGSGLRGEEEKRLFVGDKLRG